MVKRGLRVETFALVVWLLSFIIEILFLTVSFAIKDSKKKLFFKTAAWFEESELLEQFFLISSVERVFVWRVKTFMTIYNRGNMGLLVRQKSHLSAREHASKVVLQAD